MNLVCSEATQDEEERMFALNAALPEDRQWMVDPTSWWFPRGTQSVPIRQESVQFYIPRCYYATLAISSDALVGPDIHHRIYLTSANTPSVRWSHRMSPREHYFTVSQTKVKIHSITFSLEPFCAYEHLSDEWLLSWTPITEPDYDHDAILSERLSWHVMKQSEHRASGRNAHQLRLRYVVPYPSWQPYGQDLEISRDHAAFPALGGKDAFNGGHYTTTTDWSNARTGFGSKTFGFLRIMRRKTRDVHSMHVPENVDLRTGYGENTAQLTFTVDYELNCSSTDRYERLEPCLNSEKSRVRVVKARINGQDPDSDDVRSFGFWNSGYVAYRTRPLDSDPCLT
jgi:hypothetical protein